MRLMLDPMSNSAFKKQIKNKASKALDYLGQQLKTWNCTDNLETNCKGGGRNILPINSHEFKPPSKG